MNLIWKYTIQPGNGITFLNLPKGAQLLAIQSQSGFSIELWFRFNAKFKEQTETRTFEVIGTGIEYEDVPRGYLGMALTHERSFVWHIFERFDGAPE